MEEKWSEAHHPIIWHLEEGGASSNGDCWYGLQASTVDLIGPIMYMQVSIQLLFC